MSFLEDLGGAALGALNSSLGITENTPDSLDLVEEGRVTNFGKLGDFAKKIDQTAHRQYVESGYIRGLLPRQLEILMQEPDMTILIKKRMFSSLIENFKPELMDNKEKLFYRASKKVFENKCKLIAAYERLTKIERIVAAEGVLNDYLLPAVFTGLDALKSAGFGGIVDSKTMAIMETLRKVTAYSDPTYTTTWVLDRTLPALSDLGDGTGVFELTMCSNMNCTSSTMFNQGSASLTIEDPYKFMVISNEDIDSAIMQTAGGFLQSSFFSVTKHQLKTAVDDLRGQLSTLRLGRGVPDIKFLISEGSILFKKIRAIIDEEGREINFSFDGGFAGIGSSASLDPSAFEGVNGLSEENGESDIFGQVVSNLYLLLGLEQTTKPAEFEFNQDTNYVRRKMRLHFANKPMIQPMDVVHIFISSKSTIDPNSANLVASGFSPSGLMGSIDQAIGDFNNLAASFSGNTTKLSSFAVIEKDSIAGQEFPMWLWNSMKNDFTRQAAGTHVFAGIVTDASHNYTSSNGKYVLSVSATDNAGYFRFGQININPSVEVFNAALYDPLTPRELNFDASTGFLAGQEPPLLPENQALLTAGLVKFKNGRFRGSPASEQIYQGFNIERVDSSSTGSVRRKYEDPDGFVYRWKEGIQALTLMGEPHNNGTFQSESSPSLTKKPFAGQDVMNVLSLLIAGQPYNFNTFMRAAIASGGFNRDDLLNEDSSKSFFRGLLGEINKQNATWGNFVPFKKLVINEAGYNFLRSGEFDIVTANTQLSQKLRERARLFDQLIQVMPQFAENPQFLNVDINGNLTNTSTPLDTLDPRLVDPKTLGALGSNIIKLDFEIEQLKKTFTDRATSPNVNTSAGSIKIFGDDISFDPTVTGSSSALTETDRLRERSELRKKINYLTQRRLWKVKANEDPNLFIVDDSYDKNYDIQAFEKGLAGSLELFNSSYVDVASQITMTADILGLEVYADSQGHIQARPPQYNKMPSSVFYKMMQDRDVNGIQIFPSYLESLFVNQIKGMSDRLEIIEDEIRVRSAALGYVSDSAAKGLLNGVVTTSGTTNFSFVTNESDGKFGGKDIRVLLDQVNPDLKESQNSQALKAIDTALQTVIKSGANFDIIQRTKVVNNQKLGAGATPAEIKSKIDEIGKRLNTKTGLPAPTRLTILSTNKTGKLLQLDVLNVTEQIARFVAERQSIMKQLANAVKNLADGVAINTSTDPGHTILVPWLNKQKVIPEILEHMIEDEDIDDLGLESGTRYIIKEHQIINLQIREKPPAHTIVEVNGLFADGLADPPNFEATGGGNPISTAWAVDFDMWRMYGFRAPQAVPAPFLSNPDTQCAPYAVFLLNKARREIFQGDVTISGNEFIQPGEVYYIQDRDLLFYAESVTHSFNYGSGYTTSIVLKYGHNPGEYIPTILDVIGKGLYSNKHQADLSRHNRFGNANGDVPVSTVVFDRNTTESDPLKSLMAGSYGDQNRKSLTNMLLAASGALAPTTLGKQAYLELRIYFNSTKGSQADSTLEDLAGSIKEWIANPAKASTGTSGDLLPDKSAIEDVNSFNPNFNILDMITVVPVDLGETNTRSPSSGAVNKAKEVAATSGMPSPTLSDLADVNNTLDKATLVMYSQIVDCWITFRKTEQTTEANKSSTASSDQSAQLNLQKAIDAFKKKIESQSSGS